MIKIGKNYLAFFIFGSKIDLKGITEMGFWLVPY